ncbi:MAG: response regulator transcription factor [Verrucomicrobiota bacterium JB022]|nr:response regulator transcription factor [Verrucomicrobiota bacterium JB022]
MKLKIVYAEDHQLVQQGITHLLQKNSEYEIVAAAHDGAQALRLCDQFQPDILLLDLILPKLNGLEVIRQVKARSPKIAIVVLTMQTNISYVLEALKSGAKGYILKDSAWEELLDGLRTVAKGQRFLCKALSQKAIEALVEHPPKEEGNVMDTLTMRERMVLDMAANGASAGEIAQHLGISPRTAETHRGNLMKKLGLHSQTDLVRFAIRHQLIEL